jgi:hypothetical protein
LDFLLGALVGSFVAVFFGRALSRRLLIAIRNRRPPN